MGDLVRNHPALIVALLLGWLTYGAFDTETKPAKAGEKPGEIEAAMLATRSAASRPERVRSPFAPWEEPPEPGRISELPPPGAWLVAPVASARQTWLATHSPIGPGHLLAALFARTAFPGLGALDGAAAARRALADLDLPDESAAPSFSLNLESVMAYGGGGVARINGRVVAVGEELHGYDPASPPRLLAVDGQRAVLEHRAQRYELDLADARTLHLGPASSDG